MSKVDCLKEIIAKLSGENVNDQELDTVCKCLHKLAEVVSTAGSGIEDIPIEIVSGGNENVTLSDSTCVCKKYGNVYRVEIITKLTLSVANPRTYFEPFRIKIGNLTTFRGCIANCLTYNSTAGVAYVGELLVGAYSNTYKAYTTMAYLNDKLAIGEYTFRAEFTFIA